MIVFTQLASTLRHNRMSRADLFIGPFTRRHPMAGHALGALFGLVGAFVCAVLVYASWPKLVDAWVTDEFMGVEGIFTAPMWPMRLCIVIGAALTLAQYLVLVIGDLRAARIMVEDGATFVGKSEVSPNKSSLPRPGSNAPAPEQPKKGLI
jgi:TRAP-type mannitol/chloroaromatic compound transport system permease small subunit